MSPSSRSADDVLTAGLKSSDAGEKGLSLQAVGEAVALWVSLPMSGDVLLGRSVDADIPIEDPSVSRRHAVLRVGPTLTVEDLGSANGTRVGGTLLAPGEQRPIAVGEAIDLGTVIVVVQPSSRALPARPRTHAVFERKFSERCARSGSRGRAPFTLVMLEVTGPVGARDVEQALAGEVDDGISIGAYAPGHYEILLEGLAPHEASARVAGFTDVLRGLGAEARAGSAGFPLHGRTAEALIAKACADLRGPSATPERAILGSSEKMRALEHLVEKIAPGTISVLIVGETGAGKEVTAGLLHQRSRRAEKPFLKLNCGAFTESLLESELFGHERGAFTGASQSKKGLLEVAQGGTVLFDEVGELPASTQVKLLRVLEEQTILPVGALAPRPIDVRFLAATNRDLEADVAKGAFRQDLYFRLSAATVVVPPLRDRIAEIEGLATLFTERAAKQLGWRAPRITPEVLELLRQHRWPGNVRELRNAMDRAVLLAGAGEAIVVEHLPVDKILASEEAPRSLPLPLESVQAPPADASSDERARILMALARCAGNQTHAARLLGISRGTLVGRLEAYNLPRPRKGRT